jgi:sterol desaturase/sphingolipid hydroxylase (fatty acid hydroxylase superfamily)
MGLVLWLAAGAGGALLVGSLVEYGLHRALHSGWLRNTRLGQLHRAHHRPQATVQPWWREGLDYGLVALASLLGVLPCCLWLPLAFLAGWAAGAFAWAFWAAWCHERGHGPSARNGPHAWHHARPRANYGLGTHLWDRALGTWEAPEEER